MGRTPGCWLIGGLLSMTALAFALADQPADSPDSLSAIDIVHDDVKKATYYFPRIDEWPRPVALVYPVVAVAESGARVVILRMALKDPPPGFKDALRLVIDGTPADLHPAQKGAIAEDNTGCHRIITVSLGVEESLVSRIATAKDVQVLFGHDWNDHYKFGEQDFAHARQMLALMQATLLPSDPKDAEKTEAGVKMPELIPASKVFPKFPPGLLGKHLGVHAKVTVEVTIGKDGSVGNVHVVHPAGGDCGFEEAAIDAVRKWKYKPGTKNGEAVEVKSTVMLEFMTSK
jgi:TonB family protein